MKKRVMVVDDTRIMELQIEEALKDSEYEVVAYCRNGPEAIARRRHHDGHSDARNGWAGNRAGHY